MIKQVIFDFFGVIVNEPCHTEKDIRAELIWVDVDDLVPVLNQYTETLNQWKTDAETFWKNICRDLGKAVPYDAQIMFAKTLVDVNPFDGIFELIDELKIKNYTCTLLSDVFEPDKVYVEEKWWYDPFEDLILSCDIGLSKSEDVRENTSKIFEYALNKYQIDPSECVFVDDKLPNCEAANRVGIQTIHATSPEVILSEVRELLGLK